jgi:hypothetical protein
MSGWLNIVRQVYQAGGKMPTVRVVDAPSAVGEARRLGLIAPGKRGGRGRHQLVLTRRGVDLIEGRVAPRVLEYTAAFGAGRPPVVPDLAGGAAQGERGALDDRRASCTE